MATTIQSPEIIPGFAASDIRVCRFVTGVIGSNNKTRECNVAGERTYGIAQPGSVGNGVYPSSTTLAAQPSEGFKQYSYWGDGAANVLLELGAPVYANQEIKTDSQGRGIPVSPIGSVQQWCGAVAQNSGNAGDKIPVQVKGYWTAGTGEPSSVSSI